MTNPQKAQAKTTHQSKWMRRWRSVVSCCVALVGLCTASMVYSAGAVSYLNSGQDAPQEARPLELGRPIERELAGGQSHAYQITLTEGQFLSVIAQQRSIDLTVRVLGPDGVQLAAFDDEPAAQGQERAFLVAALTGRYMIFIEPAQKTAPMGKYSFLVEELRAATEKDRQLQEARKLHVEADQLYKAEKYDEAIPKVERQLTLFEKAAGPQDRLVAFSLVMLSAIHSLKGDFAKAEPLVLRALPLLEKALGPDDLHVADALIILGLIHFEKRDFAQAEQRLQRVLLIRETQLSSAHPDVAEILQHLALMYVEKADALADDLSAQGRKLFEAGLGEGHPDVQAFLKALIAIRSENGEYGKAEQLFQRLLGIQEKTVPMDSEVVLDTLFNLARVCFLRENYAKAEPLYVRLLALQEKAGRGDAPRAVSALKNLADSYWSSRNFAKAVPLYERLLAMQEQSLGREHPEVITTLTDLALNNVALGELTKAVEFQLRAIKISDRYIARNLAAGSEREKLSYLTRLSQEDDQTVLLLILAAAKDKVARDLAATYILQRKGRVLDAMTDSFAALRQSSTPKQQALLDQWKDVNAQLARLSLARPAKIPATEYGKQINALVEKKELLEAEISRSSTEFREKTRSVTLEALRAVIPEDAALVEFVSLLHYDFDANVAGDRYYLAYILRRNGEIQWQQLGEAKVIDSAINSWREALRNPQRQDVKQLARSVDEKVMQPLRPLLGNARQVLLSPDGALNLVPFAALVDEQQQYLVNRYSFSYVTSGRDLLRFQTKRESAPESFVFADPAYGENETAEKTLAAKRDIVKKSAENKTETPKLSQSVSMEQIFFSALPGTASEAEALKALLPQARVLTKEQATEAALKQVSRPRILHIATHGFFLNDLDVPQTGARAPAQLEAAARLLGITPDGEKIENPLLRSGLALAGANLRKSGEEDGILTALEAAGLDLWGTKLVVLSACDTGVGEVKNGEGVYGLRRALVLAGSETQVMSLWPVSDTATRDLMVDYYRRLQRGEGRGEALRRVQLQMLRNPKRQHPYYWASFIQSGEWANLDGRR